MLLNRRRSTVVESTLLELFKRNSASSEADYKKTVHVLLFYHMNGVSEYVQHLKQLYNHNIRVRICPDNEVLSHYDATDLAQQIGIDDFMTLAELDSGNENIEHLYIPVMPFSTVSNILAFNDTQPSIRIILRTLMSGKKVIAYSAGADPYHQTWRGSNLDNGTTYLKHKMKKKLQELKGFGIELIDEVDNIVTHFALDNTIDKKRVITAETIQKEADAGSQYIVIDRDTIITPLARDLAQKYQIKIGENRGG